MQRNELFVHETITVISGLFQKREWILAKSMLLKNFFRKKGTKKVQAQKKMTLPLTSSRAKELDLSTIWGIVLACPSTLGE